MGELIDKTKGALNESVGKAKRAIGRETDNPNMVVEGDAQEAKGDLQKAKGTVKGALGNDI